MPKRSDRRRSLTPVGVDRRGSDRRQSERCVVVIAVDCRADDTFSYYYITDQTRGGESQGESKTQPFCSERCRTIDLGNWLDGRYRLTRDDDTTDPEN